MTFGDLGPHAGFIVAAYAIFVVVVIGLIVWVVQDGAAQRRTLMDLEARGIRRRSDTGSADRAQSIEASKPGSAA